MFPFAMQAKLAEAWLGAAATGFAMASTMGATAAQSLDPWLPTRRRSQAFPLWGPGFVSSPTWPWSWSTGFGVPASASWWQFPWAFIGDWSRAFAYGAPSYGWPAPSPWTVAFPLAQSYSNMLAPFMPTSQQLTFLAPATDPVSLIAASYRTAGGHATAAIFQAMIPRPVSWAAVPSQLSPMWMFSR